MEDLSPFFIGLDATPITLFLDSGNRVITGYFDNAFFNTQLGETILDTTQPRFTCSLSDIVGTPIQTQVSIYGNIYSIFQIQPEGTGMATVQLALEPNNL